MSASPITGHTLPATAGVHDGPLSAWYGHLRDDVVRQVRCGVRHAASLHGAKPHRPWPAAGGTERSLCADCADAAAQARGGPCRHRRDAHCPCISRANPVSAVVGTV